MQLERHTSTSLKEATNFGLLREVLELSDQHRDARYNSAVDILERLYELRLRKFSGASHDTTPREAVQFLEDISVSQRGVDATLADVLLETASAIRDNHPEAKIPAPPA
ncbi:MAG: hypothetical protein G01um101419_592 [Parcubacteria group bacterium Gr01-1014_19]|nr:MAG: hypothetical protein G01um101419_592 [Parcubacteria group bacterium Gr01-1014_19]